jgi:hydrogenase maturation protease
VAARIPEAVGIGLGWLAERGFAVTEGRTESDTLADASIRHRADEAGRPSEDEACRTGDARFFPAAE